MPNLTLSCLSAAVLVGQLSCVVGGRWPGSRLRCAERKSRASAQRIS